MKRSLFTIAFLIFMLPLNTVMAAPRVSRNSKPEADSKTIPFSTTLKTAHELIKHFRNHLPTSISDVENQARHIRNPFQNRLPQPKQDSPIKTEVPDEPIEPVESVGPPPPALSISGLVWNSDRPQAIVNKTIVNINDQIEGWTITNISKEGITIRSETREVMIKP